MNVLRSAKDPSEAAISDFDLPHQENGCESGPSYTAEAGGFSLRCLNTRKSPSVGIFNHASSQLSELRLVPLTIEHRLPPEADMFDASAPSAVGRFGRTKLRV